jgi:hypothetical protein
LKAALDHRQGFPGVGMVAPRDLVRGLRCTNTPHANSRSAGLGIMEGDPFDKARQHFLVLRCRLWLHEAGPAPKTPRL